LDAGGDHIDGTDECFCIVAERAVSGPLLLRRVVEPKEK
jgi:hypothetical protein